MKKLLFILTLLIVLSLAFYAEAADEARSVDRGETGITEVVALADGSSGYMAEVDSDGNLITQPWSATLVTLEEASVTVTGACTVYGFYLYGDASSSVGDYALIYDATSVTGTPVFDIAIDVAKGFAKAEFPMGVTFSTGVTADMVDGNVFCTMAYDQ